MSILNNDVIINHDVPDSYVFCISTAFVHREDSDENNKFCEYVYKTNKFYHICDKLLRVELKFIVIIRYFSKTCFRRIDYHISL